jgi:hypothetical protein
MPFKSKAQRRWMYANHPEMAKEWSEHTPKNTKLPEYVKSAMNTQEQAYLQGFVKRAGEYGFNYEEAIALLKKAETMNNGDTVRIECPGDSGVRVQHRSSSGASIPIPGGVKKWHDFAKKYRSENPNKKFNVLTHSQKNDGSFATDAKFDKKVQEEYDKNTR